mgnify:CR=1 FL=1
MLLILPFSIVITRLLLALNCLLLEVTTTVHFWFGSIKKAIISCEVATSILSVGFSKNRIRGLCNTHLANNIFWIFEDESCLPSGKIGVFNPFGKVLIKLVNFKLSKAHLISSFEIFGLLKVKFSKIVPSNKVSPCKIHPKCVR